MQDTARGFSVFYHPAAHLYKLCLQLFFVAEKELFSDFARFRFHRKRILLCIGAGVEDGCGGGRIAPRDLLGAQGLADQREVVVLYPDQLQDQAGLADLGGAVNNDQIAFLHPIVLQKRVVPRRQQAGLYPV